MHTENFPYAYRPKYFHRVSTPSSRHRARQELHTRHLQPCYQKSLWAFSNCPSSPRVTTIPPFRLIFPVLCCYYLTLYKWNHIGGTILYVWLLWLKISFVRCAHVTEVVTNHSFSLHVVLFCVNTQQ